MSDYVHNVFVSYRHIDGSWVRWANDIFKPILASMLGTVLPEPRIFVDSQIEVGTDWPPYLASAHAHAKIFVPLLCPSYFYSDWCKLELKLAMQREQQCGYRTAAQPSVLIIPIIINDRHPFPPDIARIQGLVVGDLANPLTAPDSPLKEQLFAKLREREAEFIRSIQSAPPHSAVWIDDTQLRFNDLWVASASVQTTVPLLSTQPPLP